jgi:hypothetical protein
MPNQDYMLARPPPPSEVKRLFDQQVMPVLINLAAAVEEALQRLANGTRRAPAASVGAAFAIGMVVACLGFRRRD